MGEVEESGAGGVLMRRRRAHGSAALFPSSPLLSLSPSQAELAAQWLALDGGVKAEVRRLLLSTLGSQVKEEREEGREKKNKGPWPCLINPPFHPRTHTRRACAAIGTGR